MVPYWRKGDNMDNTEKRKIPIWFLVVVILIAMSVLGYFGTKNSNKSNNVVANDTNNSIENQIQ